MKKQHIFFGLILVILYILYLIISYKYREYKINAQIEYLGNLKVQITEEIKNAEELIEYKTTKAYKNKILKSEQGLKNKGEEVVYVTTEEKFKKYTTPPEDKEYKEIQQKILDPLKEKIKDMSVFQKWIYFLFEKDMRS